MKCPSCSVPSSCMAPRDSGPLYTCLILTCIRSNSRPITRVSCVDHRQRGDGRADPAGGKGIAVSVHTNRIIVVLSGHLVNEKKSEKLHFIHGRAENPQLQRGCVSSTYCFSSQYPERTRHEQHSREVLVFCPHATAH